MKNFSEDIERMLGSKMKSVKVSTKVRYKLVFDKSMREVKDFSIVVNFLEIERHYLDQSQRLK